jgi:glycerophosphoryl diester phosphodiesterase
MAPWPHPALIAHRGGGALAPENTLAGLRLAAREGWHAVEFDVMLCGDARPVLIHDETLDRTTDGRGRVAELSLAELARLDAGVRHGAAFAGERIPTLEQAAAIALAHRLFCNVEIKPSTGAEAQTGRVVAEQVARLWRDAAPLPLLSSFSEAALEAARAAAPDLPRGLLVDALPQDWLECLMRLDCRTLHLEAGRLERGVVAAATRAGYPVLAYTVNEPIVARRLFEWGVSAVFTDRPDRLRQALESAGRAG